ncbi:MAG: LLM class F420-dependent oxidoreductase [Actinomycetota bacterium]|nr:LLM class F420-dependent oxidoreductase [Actinomycetota bacterium]
MHPVRIGLKLSPQNTNPAELRAIWQVADQSGFDHLWNFDHFAAISGNPEDDVLEGWTMLGAMAEATSRVRIGCMVTGNTYRHPAVLAKMAVTVDHLSGGRLELGIGAAWAENEHEMLGLDFGTAGRRVEWLDEACQVMKLLFSQERTTFEGARYTLRDAIANPKPVQRPHPPLWIGGRGERKTLRVIAQHADVWNAPGGEPDEVARLAGILDAHCADVGRDPGEIRRSVQVRYAGDDAALLRSAAAFVERNVRDVIVIVSPGQARAHAEAAAELLPRLREFG